MPPSDIRYKLVTNQLGRDNFLCTLRIMGKNNERRWVNSTRNAKYRCERAEVLSIVDEYGYNYDSACSFHDKHFVYRVGDFVEPSTPYNDDIYATCAAGIHYYRTKRAAWNHFYSGIRPLDDYSKPRSRINSKGKVEKTGRGRVVQFPTS